jgi:hypothetical protein
MKRIFLSVFVTSSMMNAADNNAQKLTMPDVVFYKQEIERIDKELVRVLPSPAEVEEFANTFKRDHSDLYLQKQNIDQNMLIFIKSRAAETLLLNMDKLKQIKISQQSEIQIPELEIPPISESTQRASQILMKQAEEHSLKFNYLFKSELLKKCQENK